MMVLTKQSEGEKMVIKKGHFNQRENLNLISGVRDVC